MRSPVAWPITCDARLTVPARTSIFCWYASAAALAFLVASVSSPVFSSSSEISMPSSCSDALRTAPRAACFSVSAAAFLWASADSFMPGTPSPRIFHVDDMTRPQKVCFLVFSSTQSVPSLTVLDTSVRTGMTRRFACGPRCAGSPAGLSITSIIASR